MEEGERRGKSEEEPHHINRPAPQVENVQVCGKGRATEDVHRVVNVNSASITDSVVDSL